MYAFKIEISLQENVAVLRRLRIISNCTIRTLCDGFVGVYLDFLVMINFELPSCHTYILRFCYRRQINNGFHVEVPNFIAQTQFQRECVNWKTGVSGFDSYSDNLSSSITSFIIITTSQFTRDILNYILLLLERKKV